jgi:hypothetical protein
VCICCWCRCIQTKAKFQYPLLIVQHQDVIWWRVFIFEVVCTYLQLQQSCSVQTCIMNSKFTPPGSDNLVNPQKISRSAGKSDKSR